METIKRGGDAEQGRPHPCVLVKNKERYLSCRGGVRGPSPTQGSTGQGSSAREEVPITSGLKSSRDCG